MLLHELRHIDTHQGLFGIEEECGQRLAQLGFAHPGGTEEQEGTIGSVGIGQAGTGAPDSIGYGFDGFILPYHPLMQGCLHFQQLFTLAFQHLGYRDAGPLGYDFSDLLLSYFIAQQFHFHHFRLRCHVQLLFQFRNTAILQLGHFGQIATAAGLLQIDSSLLQIGFHLLAAMQGGLFRGPYFIQIRVLSLDAIDIVV